jgi:hypothetical protein
MIVLNGMVGGGAAYGRPAIGSRNKISKARVPFLVVIASLSVFTLIIPEFPLSGQEVRLGLDRLDAASDPHLVRERAHFRRRKVDDPVTNAVLMSKTAGYWMAACAGMTKVEYPHPRVRRGS